MRRNAILLTITFSILLFSCSSDDSSSQADAADNTDNIIQLDNDSTGPKGSLKLKIYNELNKNKTSYNNNFSLRTSLPDIDMTTDTFKISGSCSDGSTFSLLTALDEIEIRNMSLGRWIIKIEALNTDKTGIGYGEGSIEIFEREEEEPFELDILVSPHNGFGKIQVTVEWDAELDNPSIEGSIARSNSTVFDLQFEIVGNTATAEVTGAAGYYLLSVNLYDAEGDVHPYIGGAVEVVRIVEDEITPGVFYINANSEYGYGDIEIGVDLDMKDPIDVALSGQVASYNAGETMTVTASSSEESNPVTYTWYLNGELVQTDYIDDPEDPVEGISSYTTSSSLPAGPYRLDITAFNDAGDRAGSVSYHFQVLPSPPSELSYSENPAVYIINVPISDNIPTVTGGPCTYSVNPALPDGLTLNTNTGVISGTPVSIQEAEIYEVFASNAGGTTSVNLSIQIRSANSTPVADAGIDQSVEGAEIVYLDGSGSYDPEDDALTYTWVQTAGSSVELLNPYSVNPSFIAPSDLNYNEVLIFQLTVSDGTFTSLPDIVNVAIPAFQSIWSNTDIPETPYNSNSNSIEVGAKFRTIVDGYITGLRFYRGEDNPGTAFIGHLWTADGTLLAEATYPTGTDAGWQQVNLSAPVYITPDATYVVSYNTSTGYAVTRNYFTADNQSLYTGPVLFALTDGTDGGNGVYVYGSGAAFPNTTTSSTNYWADVVFKAETFSYSENPAAYIVDIPIRENIPEFLGEEGSFTIYPALPSGLFLDENTGVISGTPEISQETKNYDIYFSNSLGTASINLSISVRSENNPPVADAGIDQIIEGDDIVYLDGSASSDPDGDMLTYTWEQTGGISVELLDPYSPNPYFISPYGLSADEVLTFQLTVTDAGLISTVDSVEITVSVVHSIWDSSDIPEVPYNSDSSPIEVGAKFRTTMNGYITALRFYRGEDNPGTEFIGHLWAADGTLLAEATYPTDTDAGWQQVKLSAPVYITSDTTYIVSYNTSTGFAVNRNYFSTDNQSLYTGSVVYALADGEDGGNGVYIRGSGAVFPDSTYYISNYWTDVVFKAE